MFLLLLRGTLGVMDGVQGHSNVEVLGGEEPGQPAAVVCEAH